MINDKGIALIKEFEGCKLTAYPDPATGAAPWTIGYGCTEGVHPGMRITQAEAEAMLKRHLEPLCKQIIALVHVPLSDNQIAAIAVLAFNIGIGNFRKSTLLAKLNNRDYQGASDQFMAWNKAAGKEMPGLTRRRGAERKLFLS